MDDLLIDGEALPAWVLQVGVAGGDLAGERAPPGSAPTLVLSWHNPTARPLRVPAAPWTLVRAYVHHLGPNEPAMGHGYGGGSAAVAAEALVWVEVPPGGDTTRVVPWSELVDERAWSPGRWTLDLVGSDRVAGLAPDQVVPAIEGSAAFIVRGESAPVGDLDVSLVRRGGWRMRVHNPGPAEVWMPPAGMWLPACGWTDRDGDGGGQAASGVGGTPFYDEATGLRLAPHASLDLPVPCDVPRGVTELTVTLAPIPRLWATTPGPHAEVDRPLHASR